MILDHLLPSHSRVREVTCGKAPDDCNCGFAAPGIALAAAAAALVFAGAEAASLGQFQLGLGQIALGAAFALWSAAY